MKQAILLSILFVFSQCRPHGNHLEINGNDLFYTPVVDQNLIGKTSEYLLSTDFFAQGGKSVQLDAVKGIPIFRLVIKSDIAHDASTRETAIAFGRIIQKDLYDGKSFVFHLCDKQLNTLKAFKFIGK